MLFFDKEGKKVEPMTDQELSHLAPGRVDYDKLLILLRLETFLLFCPLFELSFFREQNPSADMLDTIVSMFEHERRSRRQVGGKLRELGLIQNIKEISRKPLSAGKREWTEEEVEKLDLNFM